MNGSYGHLNGSYGTFGALGSHYGADVLGDKTQEVTKTGEKKKAGAVFVSLLPDLLGAGVALLGGGKQVAAPSPYAPPAPPAKAGMPTWAWVALGVGAVVVLGGAGYAATR